MFVLDALDATRICSRWSEPLADPTAWAMATPEPVRREPITTQIGNFSWWAFVRNPQALLLTGVISAGLVRDALAQAVDTGRRVTAG